MRRIMGLFCALALVPACKGDVPKDFVKKAESKPTAEETKPAQVPPVKAKTAGLMAVPVDLSSKPKPADNTVAKATAPADPEAREIKAVTSPLPKAVVAPAALTFAADSWCTVLGGFSPKSLNTRAKALVEAARKLGFARTDVFAGRSFSTMTWGRLVVIAHAGDRKSAKKWAKEAKKQKLKAFAKKCVPAAGQTTDPVRSRPDLYRPPAFTNKPLAGAFDIDWPCFGWSDTHKVPGCVIYRWDSMESEEINNTGVSLKAVVLGADEDVVRSFDDGWGPLSDEQRKVVLAQMKPHGIRAWDSAALDSRVMKEPTVFRWTKPRVSVRWHRTTTITDMWGHDGPVGKMSVHDDTITVSCSGDQEDIIRANPYEGSGALRATFFAARNALLVEWQEDFWVAGHGHAGSRQDAVWVDLEEMCEPL